MHSNFTLWAKSTKTVSHNETGYHMLITCIGELRNSTKETSKEKGIAYRPLKRILITTYFKNSCLEK